MKSGVLKRLSSRTVRAGNKPYPSGFAQILKVTRCRQSEYAIKAAVMGRYISQNLQLADNFFSRTVNVGSAIGGPRRVEVQQR